MVNIIPSANAPVYLPSRVPDRLRSGDGAFSELLNQGQGPRPLNPARAAAIHKTASQLEAQFASQIFTAMFEGVEADPVFGGGHGEEMFRSFLIDEYGKAAQKRGALGLGAQIERQLRLADGG